MIALSGSGCCAYCFGTYRGACAVLGDKGVGRSLLSRSVGPTEISANESALSTQVSPATFVIACRRPECRWVWFQCLRGRASGQALAEASPLAASARLIP